MDFKVILGYNSDFKINLSYMRPSFKKKKNEKEKGLFRLTVV